MAAHAHKLLAEANKALSKASCTCDLDHTRLAGHGNEAKRTEFEAA